MKILFKTLFFVFAAALITAGSAFADVPRKLAMQGRIYDGAGVPVNDSNAKLVFEFYDGATNASIGTKTITPVNISKGLYSVVIDTPDVSMDRAIEVAVTYYKNGAGSPISFNTRTALTASPYAITVANDAITSQKIQNLALTEAKIANNAITSDKIQNGAITNDDINSSANIAVSKLAISGNSTQFLSGDGTWSAPVGTTYNDATSSQHGLMSSSDKNKLDGIASNANNYTLPTASGSTLGGIKVGLNLSIDGSGTLSA